MATTNLGHGGVQYHPHRRGVPPPFLEQAPHCLPGTCLAARIIWEQAPLEQLSVHALGPHLLCTLLICEQPQSGAGPIPVSAGALPPPSPTAPAPPQPGAGPALLSLVPAPLPACGILLPGDFALQPPFETIPLSFVWEKKNEGI